MSTPSPTLSPTDPVPRGLLTLCPGPALAHRAYIQPSAERGVSVTQCAVVSACVHARGTGRGTGSMSSGEGGVEGGRERVNAWAFSVEQRRRGVEEDALRETSRRWCS